MKSILFLVVFCSNILFAQQSKSVDFKSVTANITVNHDLREVRGTVTYSFELMNSIDTIAIDAINMRFENVKVNKKNVASKTSAKALKLYSGFKKGKNTVSFDYWAKPKQTMYFVGSGADSQIWTQGQGKYTSHWFPSFDDTNEKVVFNLNVSYTTGYTAIANGVLKRKSKEKASTTWHYQMEHPMSSYLLMLAIGKFDSKTIKAESGTPLELYIEPADVAKFEPTYRFSKYIFDYLNYEIGVDYPWKVYRQIPVRDFLYAGMENTSATIFARDFVVDSIGYNDRNYINVNAHELAHQWFGDMVTAKSGEHHWLQEGFATYYALLAEKQVFGDDYFYSKLYDMAESLQKAAKTDTIPVMNEKASSLTFYQKGAWALHVLRQGVGDKKFQTAVRNYLEKYKFKNVDTDQFLAEINKVSDYDTRDFKRRWLQTSGFNITEALVILKQSTFMNQYFEIGSKADVAYADKSALFETVMASNAYQTIKEDIILQVEQVPFEQKSELIRVAMLTKNTKVRQAIARTLRKIPLEFASEYESLLDDRSYITQEIALNNLWTQFPERRENYLNKMSQSVGMNDKNLRIQWLTLALATKEYDIDQKPKYYDELLQYASAQYESPVRLNAMESLFYIDQNDQNVLPHLVNATTHHKWQVTQFARGKIRELLKNPQHKVYFESAMTKFSAAEQIQLQKLLKD